MDQKEIKAVTRRENWKREKETESEEKVGYVCISRRGRDGPGERRNTGERGECCAKTYKSGKCLGVQ